MWIEFSIFLGLFLRVNVFYWKSMKRDILSVMNEGIIFTNLRLRLRSVTLIPSTEMVKNTRRFSMPFILNSY
jgi:hypothetical protein